MDVTLDFEESINKTDTSKMDTSQESENSVSDKDKVQNSPHQSEGQVGSDSGDNSRSSEESGSEEKEEVTETKKKISSEEDEDNESGGKETDKEDVAATVHSAEKTEKEAEEGEKTEEKEESMEVGETAAELDTIELTSNEFENDLLGAAVPAVKEDTTEACKEEAAAVPEEKPKAAPKKPAPPPKIHNRTLTTDEDTTERPRIQWECKLVKNIISTTLLKDLIEVKLNKEEENTEANLARGRRSRPIRTSGSEPKKKVVRKEDEDLDFEPESEHESESDDDRDATRDPTAFPSPPAAAVPRSRKDENRALLVTNLIRPFTVLQLKTMLSHCGKVKSIWINTIKSRCYVVFATVSEATRARQSLHGAVWPLTSPKTLNVDYAEDERMYSETDGELIGDSIDIQVFEEQKRKKPRKDKGDKKEPKKTLLDDFFKKTVAVPSIYWLPLNEKEAKARAEERAKGKPRYFVPDPDLEADYVKPRAVPRWRTPERTRNNSPPRRRADDRRRR
ncbi:hypothetical protein ACHWQZ_G008257 [Mnemiopsis leidyi]